MSEPEIRNKLNVGCGKDVKTGPGWTNVDSRYNPGAFLWDPEKEPGPVEWHDTFDRVLISHVIEHVHDTLTFMEHIHEVCKPDALVTIRCPHGASDDAWGDQTHVRPIYPNVFLFFSQPCYWRADYGYRGDFRVEQILAIVRDNSLLENYTPDIILNTMRNTIMELVCDLTAVKPIRKQDRELLENPRTFLCPPAEEVDPSEIE